MNHVENSLAGEQALLDDAVRSKQSALDVLLHPHFAERGQSGRWWTREESLNALPDEMGTYEPPKVHDLQGEEVSDGVVLVTYVSVHGSSAVGRSSLWIEHDGRMRIRWHQGTPLPEEQ